MMVYSAPTYRPPVRRMAPLGQQIVPTGVAPSLTTGPGPVSIPAAESLIWTALSAAAAYGAIRTGIRETGFNRVAGYAGGIAAGLAALVGLTGILAPSAARTLPVRWYWVA